MNILSMPTSTVELIGLQVRQFASPANVPECQKFVGRVSVVDQAFYDENGAMHVHTTDGIWLPAKFLEVVDS